MGWFDEQLKERKNNDDRVMQDAYESVVNSVIGEHFSFDEALDSLSRILRYYHLPLVKVPDEITEPEEKLRTVCRISGLMSRRVKLSPGWYHDAFGTFLAKRKDTGEYVAVIPNGFGRYSFFDKTSNRKIHLNHKTQKLLEQEAVCFYKPLPERKLHIFDLIKFAIASWSVSDFIFTFSMMGITTLIGLLTPLLSQVLYGPVINEKNISLLLSTMIFLICVNLSTLLFNAMQSLFSTRTGTKMDAAVQSATMMRVLSLSPQFFRSYSSGEILQRINYLESIATTVINMLFSTTLSSLFSLVYLGEIFAFLPQLVFPSLCIICANVLFSLLSTLMQIKVSKRQMEITAKNSGIGLSMVSGVQKIKLSGSEKRMFARWVSAFSDQMKITYNPPLFLKINAAISLVISLGGQLLIYYLTIGTGVSVADYYAFQTCYGMVYGAISSLVGISLQVAALRPSIEMAKPILDAIPETTKDTQEITTLHGSIELQNVTFRYQDNLPDVISDFSLQIKPGEYVAIVGKTGCGKSTLVRLLLGFETAQTGGIYYDGLNIERIEKKSLRQKIGTVMQDDKLFMGDIYSNIVICAPTLPLARAWEAAEISGIADDIREMPMGMHTIISDGSGGISGGQRQRMMIARAIAPKPKILIFDEATSALDNLTQKKVSEALDQLSCTRIVIAHRLSTIRHCDRILVMDKGKIIEEGSYEALVRQNGFFAELVNRQQIDAPSENTTKKES